MFVYLDESGDCGFKFRQGSSQYFVVALVITDDPESVDRKVDDFRTSIGFRDSHEFKFYKTDRRRRNEFLRVVARLPIRIRLLVIDKTLMTQPQLQKRETFYGFMLKMMLERSLDVLNDGTLILDRIDTSKKNQQTLSSYLKRALTGSNQTPGRLRVRHYDSRSHGALPVADMVAGAAFAAHKNGDAQYIDLIREKIEDEWIWWPYRQIDGHAKTRAIRELVRNATRQAAIRASSLSQSYNSMHRS